MANTTIPNLPATTSLTGPEELNVVQSNTSKYTTVAQIGAYVNANYPAQGITRITAASPLSGGTITTTGTIGLTSNGVTNAYLATMSPYTIKANITSGTVAPTDATLTAILDTLGSTQGMTLYRGNTSWSTLPSSGTNTLLSVSGPNANPAWQTLSYMIDNAINSASAQGTILYRGASSWSALAPGTSGQILQTQGASANPQWASISGAGTVTSVNASGGSTGLNFTGGPITSSGTLTMGGTLGTGYGGTNLTSFTSGGAVYATSTSALTTGILPVASGGTGSSSPSLVAGTNVTISGSWPNQTINASGGGGSGTVTSVNVSGGTTGLTTSGGPITGSGTITLAGTLAIASGGTGQTTASAAFNALSPITSTGDLIIGNGTNSATRLGIGTNGYVLTSNGTTASWAASTGGVTSFSAGSTGLTPSTATTGAITLAGTLAVANGGTGVTTSSGANSVVLRDANSNITANYLYTGYSNTAAAGTTTTLTAASAFSYVVTGSGGQTFKLPDATTLSAGATYIFNNNQASGTIVVQNNSATTVVTVQSGAIVYLTLLTNSAAAGTWDTHYQAPSNVTWSTNTLDYAGSITSATWNGVAIAANRGGTGVANNVASTLTITGNFGTTFTVTGTTSVTLPTSGTLATTSNTVASFSGGSTGLTPSTATTGAVTLAGTLIVGNGGTGATTLTGVLKGNGTSAFTAATAGTDYVAPGTATTFTATQTFNGSSSVLASVLVNAAETMTISATAATGTINYDVTTQSVLYYTSNASANWTVNFRASSGTSLNTAMSTGQSVTVAFLVTQGSTAYYNNVVQVDGTSVTPKYQGGTAWSAGNASSVDIYTYTIVKTGSAAFTVFASQTQFK
jgi:hypothetical protein